MGLFSRFTNRRKRAERVPDIEELRGLFNWDEFEKKYYSELDFLEIEDKIDSIKRKKTITPEEASERKWCSIGYFDGKNRLLRIDYKDVIPTETYLIWEDDFLTDVFLFRLGYCGQEKVSDKPELHTEWHYKYNDKKQLIRLVVRDHPDVDYKFYNFPHTSERRLSYEYDEKGLLKAYQLYGIIPGIEKNEEVVIYDRERETLLLESSVSKTPYISKSRKPKKPVLFKRGYYTQRGKCEIPVCQKCNTVMSYLGYVDLEDPRIKKKPPLTRVPIFYCFNCMGGRTYDLVKKVNFKKLSLKEIPLFAETEIDFVKSHDVENNKEAFVKIGGLPDWIQEEEYPLCSECGGNMVFVCQLNSAEELSNGKNVQMFGDSGMVYTFTCCNIVTTKMQCY